MLRQEILTTVAYYDVLDMPLTAEDTFRYLLRQGSAVRPSYPDVRKALSELAEERYLSLRDAYYYSRDREYLVPLRYRNIERAEQKWDKTMRIVRWLRHLPFIRMIFVSGSLSMSNTDELSDLDVILVVRHGRIWFTRALVVGLLSLVSVVRKHEDRSAPDKICPNHFITDRSLHIPFQSIYTAQLYAHLIPVYTDDPRLITEFQIKNEWMFKFLHHWQMPERARYQGSTLFKRATQYVFKGRGGDTFDHIAMRYQQRRIARRAAPVQGGGHLTFTDEALAFHSKSSETDILRKYESNKNKLTD